MSLLKRLKPRSHGPALVRASRDPDAFAEFYEQYAERVLIFMTRRVFDVELAFDLTSETFALALERSEQFRGSTAEEEQGWLFAIARNLLYGRRLGIVWEHVRQAGDLRTAIRLDTRGGRPRLVGRVDSTAETTYSHVGVDLVHGRLFWGTDCVGQTCAGGEQGASFVSRVRIEGLEQEGIAYLSGTDRLAASAQARSSGVSVRAEGFSLQSGGGARCRDLDDPALAREPGCRIVVEELSFGAPRP